MVIYEVLANYYYVFVFKLFKEVYFIVEIIDWLQYSLFNGDVNLFFKGIYQGDIYLDMAVFEDILFLFVGWDEDIIVKCEWVWD